MTKRALKVTSELCSAETKQGQEVHGQSAHRLGEPRERYSYFHSQLTSLTPRVILTSIGCESACETWVPLLILDTPVSCETCLLFSLHTVSAVS